MFLNIFDISKNDLRLIWTFENVKKHEKWQKWDKCFHCWQGISKLCVFHFSKNTIFCHFFCQFHMPLTQNLSKKHISFAISLFLRLGRHVKICKNDQKWPFFDIFDEKSRVTFFTIWQKSLKNFCRFSRTFSRPVLNFSGFFRSPPPGKEIFVRKHMKKQWKSDTFLRRSSNFWAQNLTKRNTKKRKIHIFVSKIPKSSCQI